MNEKEYTEICDRRLNAYIRMLEEAYEVDSRGLADMVGIHRQTMTKYIKAPFMKKGIVTTFKLAEVTGISIDWLCGSDLDFDFNTIK